MCRVCCSCWNPYTLEPVLCNKRPLRWDGRTTQLDSSPVLASTGKGLHAAMKTQRSRRHKGKKKEYSTAVSKEEHFNFVPPTDESYQLCPRRTSWTQTSHTISGDSRTPLKAFWKLLNPSKNKNLLMPHIEVPGPQVRATALQNNYQILDQKRHGNWEYLNK